MIIAPIVLALSMASVTTRVDGPYKVLQTSKVGGDGGFDYVYADAPTRKLYVPRSGQGARISVYDLDTFAPAGEIANTNAHGATVDAKYRTGFSSSKPVAMWNANTLIPIKTIDVDGRPDGIMDDPFNHRVYIFSHQAPNATVIDAKDGTVLGTIDLGGQPEQAATDGHGTIYVDLEDKAAVAVVDARTMKVTRTFSLGDKGGGNAGLALDPRNHVLFVACREPQAMVIIDARDGHFLASLPIGRGCDGAFFNPRTNECFSSQGDGTLTIIKEDSPTTFSVEETVQTMVGAKTSTLDAKTGRAILIAAQFVQPPAGENNGGGRPRRQLVPGSFSVIAVGK